MILAGTAANAGPAAGPAIASAAARWRVTPISPPPGGGPASELSAVSCASAGSCVAGGSDGPQPPEIGPQHYLTVTKSHGTWALMPSGQLPVGTDDAFSLNGIACPAVGFCVAVGSYVAGGGQGFIAVERHGAWVSAIRPSLPRNSAQPPDAALQAVTCTGPGSCVAVGRYYTKTGSLEQMSVSESGGRWHSGTVIGFPAANLSGANELDSVACGQAGSCVAVGMYSPSDVSIAPITAIESNGRWHQAEPLRPPAGAGTQARLTSVSCLPSGVCIAVGWYVHGISTYGMMARLSDGHWSKISPLTRIPADAPRGSRVVLDAVSCARTFCLAAGSYQLSGGSREWIAIRIRRGTWNSATEIRVPAGTATALGLMTSANAVSCTGGGSCAIAGFYANKLGTVQALVAASS